MKNSSALKNPWVIGWVGMILIVLTANVVMMTIAYKTSPGLVTEDYYDRGKNYDKTVAKRAAETALNWKTELLVPDDIRVNSPARYQVLAEDDKGRPLSAEKVSLFAFRPSDANADFSVTMKEDESGNRYSGSVSFPLPGVWDIIVSIRRGTEQFEISRRIFASADKK